MKSGFRDLGNSCKNLLKRVKETELEEAVEPWRSVTAHVQTSSVL